jgi:hypothetical protein
MWRKKIGMKHVSRAAFAIFYWTTSVSFEIRSFIVKTITIGEWIDPFHVYVENSNKTSFAFIQSLWYEVYTMLRENLPRWDGDASSKLLRLSCQLLCVLLLQSTFTKRRTICIPWWTINMSEWSREGVIFTSNLRWRVCDWGTCSFEGWEKGTEKTSHYFNIFTTKTI